MGKDRNNKVSAWVRRVGWRIYIANGIANLRRSPRVKGGKDKQEQVPGRERGREIKVKKTERKQQIKGERGMIRVMVLVGDFNARVGTADQPADIIGQYGEEKRNTNGVEMLKFLGNTELRTLNDKSTKARGTMDMD